MAASRAQRRDDHRQNRAERLGSEPPAADRCGREEDEAHLVCETWRPRVLEPALSDPWLDQLEVREARAGSSGGRRRGPIEELQPHQCPGERPAEGNARRARSTKTTVWFVRGRALVDHVEIAVGVGRAQRSHGPDCCGSPPPGPHRLGGALAGERSHHRPPGFLRAVLTEQARLLRIGPQRAAGAAVPGRSAGGRRRSCASRRRSVAIGG